MNLCFPYLNQSLSFPTILHHWDCNLILHYSHSLLWNHVIQITPSFYPHIHFALGCGNHIRFWKDLWWGNSTLEVEYLRLYSISNQKNSCVADVLSSSLSGIVELDFYSWVVWMGVSNCGSIALILEWCVCILIWAGFTCGDLHHGIFLVKSFLSIIEKKFHPNTCFQSAKYGNLWPPKGASFFMADLL